MDRLESLAAYEVGMTLADFGHLQQGPPSRITRWSRRRATRRQAGPVD